MERCDGCGFAWEAVRRDEIAGGVDAGTVATQYAAHLRDVLLMLRVRFVIGLVEDVPVRRSLLRMGQQAVHEVEHHGRDIAENLGLS